MATDHHATDFPVRAGFAARLREAWQVLRGARAAMTSAVSVVADSRRAADHPPPA